MDSIEKMKQKREAQRRRRAQRQRMGRLRSRVVAISLIAFVLLWGVVFAQMATGNDEEELVEPEPEPAPVTTSQS